MHALLAKMVELKKDGLGRVFSSLPTILPPWVFQAFYTQTSVFNMDGSLNILFKIFNELYLNI